MTQETPLQSFKRIAHGLQQFANHTVGYAKHTAQAAALIAEAKSLQIWKLKYSSFKEFCEKECGFTASWANELVKTHKTILELQTLNDKSLVASDPENKGNSSEKVSQEKCLMTPEQRKVLDGLSSSEKVRVWEAAKELFPNPSPKLLAQVRKTILVPPTQPVSRVNPPVRARFDSSVYTSDFTKEPELKLPPGKPEDVNGDAVPEHLLPLWNRSEEVKDAIGRVLAIKNELAALGKSGDQLWASVNFQSIQSNLNHAASALRDALPHAICPKCSGKGKCDFCYDRGFVGKRVYDLRDAKPVKAESIKHFQELWCAAVKKRTGEVYKWDWVRDGKAAKSLLNGTEKTAEELMTVAEAAWDNKGWNCKHRMDTVQRFNSAWNSIVAELQTSNGHRPGSKWTLESVYQLIASKG